MAFFITQVTVSVILCTSMAAFASQRSNDNDDVSCYVRSNPNDFLINSMTSPPQSRDIWCGLHCERGTHKQVCGGPYYNLVKGPDLNIAQCRHLYGNETCDEHCVVSTDSRVDCWEIQGRRSTRTECQYDPWIPNQTPHVAKWRSCSYRQRVPGRAMSVFKFYHGQVVQFSKVRGSRVTNLSTDCVCMDGRWKKDGSVTPEGELKDCKWIYRGESRRRKPTAVRTPYC